MCSQVSSLTSCSDTVISGNPSKPPISGDAVELGDTRSEIQPRRTQTEREVIHRARIVAQDEAGLPVSAPMLSDTAKKEGSIRTLVGYVRILRPDGQAVGRIETIRIPVIIAVVPPAPGTRPISGTEPGLEGNERIDYTGLTYLGMKEIGAFLRRDRTAGPDSDTCSCFAFRKGM